MLIALSVRGGGGGGGGGSENIHLNKKDAMQPLFKVIIHHISLLFLFRDI